MSRFFVLARGLALPPPLFDFFDDLDLSCPRASGIDAIQAIVNAAARQIVPTVAVLPGYLIGNSPDSLPRRCYQSRFSIPAVHLSRLSLPGSVVTCHRAFREKPPSHAT